MRCRSFAKINLHLQVLGKRPDGYHELLTVFQTIDLHDTLTFEDAPRGEISLAVHGADLTPGPDNLVHCAAAAFADRFRPRRGVAVTLEKRIPMGAGLGGGSSNAATALLGLRQREGRPDSREELVPLARSLGADVPYFLTAGTAVGSGRGDEVRALPDLDEEPVILALPPIHLATREVFAAARPGATELPPAVAALLEGTRPASLAALGGENDLEPAVMALRPELDRVPELLRKVGASRVVLTGSGAAFVGLLPEHSAAPFTERMVDGVRLLRVRTLSRAGLRARLFD